MASRQSVLDLDVRPAPLVAVALLAGALVTAQGSAPIAQGPPHGGKRIELLFLGHTRATEATDPKTGGWYHDSDRFAPMLKAALAPYGFNFSYTTDAADLNATNLARYDALLIYSNHRAIAAPQEKALLDFVAGGKGLLALHSASFCFQNSPAYTALVGAQFERHGTGEFTAAFVNPSHPLLAGLQPFPVWDETYVHTKLGPDRTVLMERAEGAGREPWTWVRTHGEGRVFYTAYGHDERVWGHPSFHALMKNAMTWAIGGKVADQLSALAIAPLHTRTPRRQSRTTSGGIPRRGFSSRSRQPSCEAPAETSRLRAAAVRGRAAVTGNPVAMAWDERGRLWIAETRDYPNNPQPAGGGKTTSRS